MPPGTQAAMASAQPINQPSHRGAPVSQNIQQAVSPPSKEQLKSWWRVLGRRKEKEDEKVPIPQGIFGVPLSESILYANVAISLTNEEGESFIYGYVPIVVAKCGVFLKEKATDVEGIFRLSGSAKRIKDLQTIFNSPDRYGKGLDWTGYTVHDAANILRRYLNQLPEPIVPLDFYDEFRNPLRAYQAKAGNGAHHQVMENQEHAVAVHAYQALIKELPALNRQLLLYILDLLAVFASKSDLNRMTAQNLAAIFQPGIISHPDHDMAPNEYRLSQDVLIFLIENQDNFLIGMNGTAMDDTTKEAVKSGPPSIKTPKTAIGRSASTASAGADSLRRTGGIRRGGSTSSRNSRGGGSPGISSPATPASPSAFAAGTSNAAGLTRSNTVPSNRSPAMGGPRFHRMAEASPSTTPTADTTTPISGSPSGDTRISNAQKPITNAVEEARTARTPSEVVEDNSTGLPESSVIASQDSQSATNPISIPVNGKQTRERKITNLFPKSPIFGPSDQQLKEQQPNKPRNKLQKRRLPGTSNDSAQSSQASLNTGEDGAVFQTPALTPNALNQDRPDPMETQTQTTAHIVSSPTMESVSGAQLATSPPSRDIKNQNRGLMPPTSPTPSIHSRGSVTDPSDLDALEDPATRQEKKKNRFRLSAAWRNDEGPLAPPPPVGQNTGARNSNSSLGSHVPRKSFTGDSQATQTSMADTSSLGQPSTFLVSSRESGEPLHAEPAKKENVFSKWKAKLSGKGDAERAKSPPRLHPDQTTSRNSLSAIAHEAFPLRGRSMDKPREELLPIVQERPIAEEMQAQRHPQAPIQTQYPVTVQNPGSIPYPRPQEPISVPGPVSTTTMPQIQAQPQPQIIHPSTAPAGMTIIPTPMVSNHNMTNEPVSIPVQEPISAQPPPQVLTEPIAGTANLAAATGAESISTNADMREISPTAISPTSAPIPETLSRQVAQQQTEIPVQPKRNSASNLQPNEPTTEVQGGQHAQ